MLGESVAALAAPTSVCAGLLIAVTLDAVAKAALVVVVVDPLVLGPIVVRVGVKCRNFCHWIAPSSWLVRPRCASNRVAAHNASLRAAT